MDFGEWDKGFDITGYIKLFPRILKENANVVIFNAWENLGEIAKVCREFNIAPKRCLVLSKSNPAPFNRDRMFVNDVEFAIWGVYNSKNKPSKWTFNRENLLEKCVIPTTVQSSEEDGFCTVSNKAWQGTSIGHTNAGNQYSFGKGTHWNIPINFIEEQCIPVSFEWE